MVQKTDIIPLAKPFITQESIDNAVSVLQSGQLVQGKFVEELENKLCAYLQIKHSILISSGTMALVSALHALDIKPGDEIVVPAFSFIATANVVEAVGAKPVFVDIS